MQTIDFMFSDQIEYYKKDQYAAENVNMYRLRWIPKKFRYNIYYCAKHLHNLLIDITAVLNNKKLKA